jgi:magnesium transporter
VALLREVDPGEIGLAGRVKPVERQPPRTVLFEGRERRDGVPVEEIAARLASGGAFFFADFHAPDERELEALRREFRFHPLAIEDVRTRHQRPKIDIYGDQYFLVFYRIAAEGHDGDWLLQEIDFFIGPNFLIATHDSIVPLLDETLERFAREEGKKDVSGLLYDLLDAIVDEYFVFLDDLGERSEQIEDGIFAGGHEREDLQRLLAHKSDLALLRRIVAPERDSINVLLRRDPPVLDSARIFYFQDIYDHLIRIADSIDTYRDLATSALDAVLSVQNNLLAEQNNRLAEVVKKLTVISIIFLPLNFITGFWGMNFEATSGRGNSWFFGSLAVMALIPIVMIFFLRRRGIE